MFARFKWTLGLLIGGVLLLMVVPLTAQTAVTATTRDTAPIYQVPGQTDSIIAELEAGAQVEVAGRSEFGHWLAISSGSTQGWLATGSAALAETVNLYDLPVLDMPEMATPQLSEDPAILAKLDRLMSFPILYNTNTEAVKAIFSRGQELGNRADVFIKVGDSNTTSGDFLRPFGMEHGNCDLGSYAYLQETIDYFDTPPKPGFTNSWNSDNMTAVMGLTTSASLDSFWADKTVCNPNEPLLNCEYRVTKPATAIIMLGLMDLELIEADLFKANLERIIQSSAEQGVIPVFTTFTVLLDYPTAEQSLWAKSLDINLAIVDTAEQYGTPVIHLWKGLQTVPAYGIGPDRTHLRHEVGSFCSFTGAEQRVGGTLRNLLSAQILDELRRNVFTANMTE